MSKAGSNVVGSQPVGKPLHGEKLSLHFVLLPRDLLGRSDVIRVVTLHWREVEVLEGPEELL